MSNKQFLVAIMAFVGLLCNVLLWSQLGALVAYTNPSVVPEMNSVEYLLLMLGAAGGFATTIAFAVLNPILEKNNDE